MGYQNSVLSFKAFATKCENLTKSNQCKKRKDYKCKKYGCPKTGEFLKQGGKKRQKWKNRFEKSRDPALPLIGSKNKQQDLNKIKP